CPNENGLRGFNGLSGVDGAIDSSHIPIRTPKEHLESYIDQKGFPFIIKQEVCDSNLNFTENCGCLGSLQVARVLKNSPLFMGPKTDLNKIFGLWINLFDGDQFLTKNTYGNLTEKSKRFNYLHSSTRICIERAFGALKGRFR
ncbi:HARB1-like protein, partial [Mya arenaria]